MKVLFLGTAAFDYSSKLATEFIDCFDLNARRSSSALLNDKYLIDCGDHGLDSLRIAKADIAKISDVFITHLHRDHYNSEYIESIAKKKNEELRVWVRADAVVPKLENVVYMRMEKGKKYAVDGELCVAGFLANHEAEVFPQHLLFEDKEKSFFYGLDGAWFVNETYRALKNRALNCIVLDGSCGESVNDYRVGSHNSIPMLRVLVASLRTLGTVTADTQVYISHLAPSLHVSHEETVAILQKDRIAVAYDGLQIEF